MTYVEFFAKTSIENVCSCLSLAPQRVVLIGSDSRLMRRHIERYDRVFRARGEAVEFSYRSVNRNDLFAIVSVLQEVLDSCEGKVAVDLTGGEELFLVAMGMVFAKNPDRHIEMHRFQLQNGRIVDCDGNGSVISTARPRVSIEENMQLYGGAVLYGNEMPFATHRWQLTEDFLADIDLIWQVCRQNVRYWNTQSGVLGLADRYGSRLAGDALTTVVRYATVPKDVREQVCPGAKMVRDLRAAGLLTDYRETDDGFSITYKNEQIKRCITKAGLALEMKIFSIARSLKEKDGTPFFGDVMNGVCIDWDGQYDPSAPGGANTQNEIDVMMMRGVVPVFVSCKNGKLTQDELYKLHTVATRFGGRYARPVLVCSLQSAGTGVEYLRQRAADMGIALIERPQSMSDEALRNALIELF